MKPKFKRKCPQCAKIIQYTRRSNCNRLIRKNSPCKACSLLILGKRYSGEGNPFYGKKHTKASRQKIRGVNQSYKHSRKFSDAVKLGMVGKSVNKTPVYACWVRNYGKRVADYKFKKLKQLQSARSKGCLNNMFGKPAPKGSGNGWSGWYKHFFFRSLRELSFILECESKGQSIVTAESQKYKIPLNSGHNYFPDFLVNGHTLVECKPKSLWNNEGVLLKKEAALSWCGSKKLQYKLVDPKLVSITLLTKMKLRGKIRFTRKSEEKFIKYVCKQGNNNKGVTR